MAVAELRLFPSFKTHFRLLNVSKLGTILISIAQEAVKNKFFYSFILLILPFLILVRLDRKTSAPYLGFTSDILGKNDCTSKSNCISKHHFHAGVRW